jgi:hypothetical protein
MIGGLSAVRSWLHHKASPPQPSQATTAALQGTCALHTHTTAHIRLQHSHGHREREEGRGERGEGPGGEGREAGRGERGEGRGEKAEGRGQTSATAATW